MEHTFSTRTWFGTLTFRPEERLKIKIRARRKSDNEDFPALAAQAGKEFTKFLKKLRKAGHKFRYLMVMEKHKDGFPHIHVLIHEGAAAIPKRELETRWSYGFTNFKICDETTVKYVCKYLTKSKDARVRASLRYGDNGLIHSLDEVDGVKTQPRDPPPTPLEGL